MKLCIQIKCKHNYASKGKIKVKFALEQARKAHSGSRGIAVLFL